MLYRAHLGPPPGMAHGPVVGICRGRARLFLGRRRFDGGDMWRDADAAAGVLLESGARPPLFRDGRAGGAATGWGGCARARAPRRRRRPTFPTSMIGRPRAQLTREAEEQAAPGRG